MSAPFSDPGIPVLTERHDEPGQAAVADIASDTVLRALLQAELEQAIEQAAAQAAADMRARLEAELPGIVDRALQRLRPG
ncbi:hypothetical protein [Bordetella hinzii]|jgi:hypothetical protein|uniref:Uncharacterized protein n=2 Tax=Bordetella hinzii TaxID=103855 RepID=A0AAN1VGF9_9BORD|nr:hypothetical protein [Bordetella hinzii]AKQ56588.1 hypothetical protein ACR54_03286 [Bordetella hinzii]AKQ61046.1 hypothetical protein ACR55_03196 [Bordetella hinzii]AZW17954.1 hypothetical protein CS347_14845 [Bordetella hinzii]KCB22137.1 hypothetical protein L544_2771 [Bordetella hinzii OH87 BAL007II]KCB31251.1 hypothetical protein L543_2370 [Bordetella hinzii L60]